MMSSKEREVSRLRGRGLAEAVKVSRNSKKRERLNLQIPEVGRGSLLRGRSPHLLNHHRQRSKSRVMGTNLILRWINGGRGIEAVMIWTSRSGFNKN
jgi:hypothetical protein